MNEKRKSFRVELHNKPRFSQLVSIALVLVVFALFACVGVKEYQRWHTTMRQMERQLQERSRSLIETESRLQAVEAQLKDSRRKLAERKPLWKHLLKPVGLILKTEPIRFPTGAACTFLPRSSSAQDYDQYDQIGPIIFYYPDVFHLPVLNGLADSDEYIHVGSGKLSADWNEEDFGPSSDYYVRKDLIDQYQFEWSSSKLWIENWRNWKLSLTDYCYKKFGTVRLAANDSGIRMERPN